MWLLRIKPYSILPWSVCLLHTAWALGLLASPDIAHVTPIAPMLAFSFGQRWLLVCLLLLASSGSLWMLTVPISRPWHLVLGMPQQLLLFVSAFGTLYYGFLGQYADGTVASHLHLLLDQLPVSLLALGHFASLILLHWVRMLCPAVHGFSSCPGDSLSV